VEYSDIFKNEKLHQLKFRNFNLDVSCTSQNSASILYVWYMPCVSDW